MKEYNHGTCPRCEREMISLWEGTKMTGGTGAAWNASIKALVCQRCWGIIRRSN